jgi:uncharacterized protein YbbC (DUF1343 family)
MGSCPLDSELAGRLRRSAGLLTHPAAVTRELVGAPEALQRAGVRLVALFGPEHGIRGESADGRAVPSSVDARSGLPIYSLYSETGPESRSPAPELLAGLEVLLIDLQDVGARFYTYASSVSLCMQAAATAGVPVVLLDRPNPIGDGVEGPVLRREFASFVGLHPIPIRHGCTLGELALLFHRAFGVGEEPFVVPAKPGGGPTGSQVPGNEIYSLLPTAVSYPWVPPSPNMPTPLTALVYPGTALLEGTNVSEGRGTARPFEWVGAPWVEANTLAQHMAGFALPGVRFRPVHFTPTASKWQGETCAGVQVHLTDPISFRPVLTGVALLAALRGLWSRQFAWRESQGSYPVDRLAGTDRLRLEIEQGWDPHAIAAGWAVEEAEFRSLRVESLDPPGSSAGQS